MNSVGKELWAFGLLFQMFEKFEKRSLLLHNRTFGKMTESYKIGFQMIKKVFLIQRLNKRMEIRRSGLLSEPRAAETNEEA